MVHIKHHKEWTFLGKIYPNQPFLHNILVALVKNLKYTSNNKLLQNSYKLTNDLIPSDKHTVHMYGLITIKVTDLIFSLLEIA